jgi:hypothetical protein
MCALRENSEQWILSTGAGKVIEQILRLDAVIWREREFFLHSSAPAYSTVMIKHFLAICGIVISQPPYAPDQVLFLNIP